MAFLMPEMTVEVYNADYRVLSRIPWQEAVRLILRGAVYVIDVHRPAVHVHSPSLAIERSSLPQVLQVTATSDDGEIMGVRHREYAVEGVQFHPEAILTEHGKRLLANFLEGKA